MNNEDHNTPLNYDELKRVIVEANLEANQKEIHDYKTRHPFRSRFLKIFNGIIYATIAIIAFSLLYEQWALYFDGNSTLSVFYLVLISLLLAALVLSFFILQQETFDDNPKETEISFSTNISLVALIIAIIALVR